MNSREYWFKFIISGNPDDYIKYVNSLGKEEGEPVEYRDRRISDKGNEYGGSRPSYYGADKG